SKIPVQSREVGGTQESDDEARRQRRKMRREKKAPADPSQPIKLEDEIQEFMNRDKKEGTTPDEIAEFLGGFDPTEVPES
ncbi:MAG: hypothetical protein L0170_11465, partial [Acidobacteria bacterium]|nr:hypothetical protein [Acidobacteriota bacterium]